MNRLAVALGELPVGLLERHSGDTWRFRLLQSYLDLKERPILGQSFEDDLERVHKATLRLPPFFSNLLPEGPLRELLARHAGVSPDREAQLLQTLGQDLPGAVVVTEEPAQPGPEYAGTADAAAEAPTNSMRPLKFSLAGVQLKFSVIRQGERLTVPASGQGGDWILKLPDQRYPGVPENEYSMLLWAASAGLRVPESRLVPVAEVEGLPEEVRSEESLALAVRRFDRAENGQRVHQEDFAQVLGIYPHEKYEKYNFETIARIVFAVAGLEALEELVRRLAFMVLSGNGDAHHKNWSLVYPESRRGELAPAYDLVFTRAYLEDDRLALNLGGSKDFEKVTVATFRRLATKVGVDPDRLAEIAGETANRVRKAFVEVRRAMRMSTDSLSRLRRHLDMIRL